MMQREANTPPGLLPLDKVDLSDVPEGVMPSMSRFIAFPPDPVHGDRHECLNPFGGASWQTWVYDVYKERWVLEKDE